jgi:Na+/phosphate symporter
MLIVITIAGLVCLVGLLMYVLASNPKLQELGRLMFFAGLLVLLLNVGVAVKVFP